MCQATERMQRGEFDRVLSPHSLYQALGNDATARQVAYQKLFRFELDSGLLNEIKRRLMGVMCLFAVSSSGKWL